MTNTLIAGETIEDLARALIQIRPGPPRADGSIRFTAKIPREIYEPFRRAMMRIEAELLAAEADQLSTDDAAVERTDDQRRLDAFEELVRRCSQAAAAISKNC